MVFLFIAIYRSDKLDSVHFHFQVHDQRGRALRISAHNSTVPRWLASTIQTHISLTALDFCLSHRCHRRYRLTRRCLPPRSVCRRTLSYTAGSTHRTTIQTSQMPWKLQDVISCGSTSLCQSPEQYCHAYISHRTPSHPPCIPLPSAQRMHHHNQTHQYLREPLRD